MDDKFKSGNDIEVSRAAITKEEYEILKECIDTFRSTLEVIAGRETSH